MVFIGAHHRARMKSGNLVIVQIGRYKGLCRKQVSEFLDELQANATFLEMGAISRKILANGCHRDRITAQ